MVEKHVQPNQIGVMGLSLGTAVSSGLVASLAQQGMQLALISLDSTEPSFDTLGVSPRALLLVAPFSSIPKLIETFKLFAVIPILGPFRSMPWLISFFLKSLHTQFDTLALINDIKCPILIVHSSDDITIPIAHSQRLVTALLEPELIKASLEHSGGAVQEPDQLKERERVREELVQVEPLGRWGVVRRFNRNGAGRVVYAEAVTGGHNAIGCAEATVSLVREVMLLN